MGNRVENATMIGQFIKKSNPKAKTLLELACGTGSVLQYFTKSYEVYGLDMSSGMLALAKKRVPSGKFSQQNMTKFKIDKKFVVILCIFDSINHLLEFSDWRKVLERSYSHLNEGGVMIFDMNTRAKLTRHIKEKPWVHQFGKNLLIMDVQDAGNKVSNWNVKVYEQKSVHFIRRKYQRKSIPTKSN